MPDCAGPLPDPRHHLDEPDGKRRYTRRVFDLVAPRYDRFTRWFSFGMDARWKRRLARLVAARLPPGAVVLDLACGTGDLVEAVGRANGWAAGRLVGMDASATMLTRASARFARRRSVWLIRGDLCALPIPDASVDAVTIGYGFRSAPDLDVALAETARVLRPGGVLASLDFFLPPAAWWRAAFRRYLRYVGRFVGRWWHREPEAYGYIEASLRHWITADELGARLRARGFRPEAQRSYLGGGIAVHAVRR